ncbi:response regulator transcription factor [Clostridium sp. CM028]|uniref:response regulator transcription factor n=1 Tax=unclassified Clostridium TaxID=2614128 RepID=UPI001C0B926D|nr:MULTISPECIES: response regulator transcription factor [unclassified Clostridium]MBU3093667.1 response regulator transcription factor [Clostridium sp. CF011]MBW9146149.1 response regulator transcription factor [Clostridium sp. CM027]MBW9148195.1 response regulator transcription factor [Clostridium sp. CM028]UVE41677.1 response regulator transcription factor [Clostridium sp. CM027]WAG70676.1 response regulator transcription factor [Clostridium sp. CF011]
MFKIMIVEDDIRIKEILLENVMRWGFDGKAIENFNEVFIEFSKYSPHLVLMDINLPYFDGFYWCYKIREISKVPIIFVSSRNNNMDVIMAINMGGDDFIQKPFSLEILMAKINALIRRTYSYADAQTNVLEYKNIVLNMKDNSVFFKDKRVELSRNEFSILYLLMKNNGNLISRDKIMRSLWEDESFVDDNTLTVNINRLRKKLENIELEDLIKTKKRQGYTIL